MMHVYISEALSNRLRKGDGHRDTSRDKHYTRDVVVIARRDITGVPLYLEASSDVTEVSMIVSL